MNFFKEFLEFLKERKKVWLFPIIIILGLFGIVVVAGQGSVVSPLVYAIF